MQRAVTSVAGSAEQSESADVDETDLLAEVVAVGDVIAALSTNHPQLQTHQDKDGGPADVPDAADAVEVGTDAAESHSPVVVVEGKRVCRECGKARLYSQAAYDRGVCLSCFIKSSSLEST
jgi:hypothetical protein